MNVALCTCGIDMSEHDEDGHPFTAAGTKYRCEKMIDMEYLCPRPMYHQQEGIRCGPLTGERLWGYSSEAEDLDWDSEWGFHNWGYDG